MNLVFDASAVVAALVEDGVQGQWVISLMADASPVAPDIVLVEAANALRRLELGGHLSPEDATSAHEDLQRISIETFTFAPFATRVWELRSNLTSYDASYVALAEAFQVPCVTLDKRLSRSTGPECEFLIPP